MPARWVSNRDFGTPRRVLKASLTFADAPLELLASVLEQHGRRADLLHDERADHVAFVNLARVGETLLSALLDGKKIDTTPIRTFLFAEG